MLIAFYISLIPLIAMGIYPLISWVRYRLFKRPVKKDFSSLEPVSIIISCYNEEAYIKKRIDSMLSTDEWIEGSEIIVVSTGSTDKTNELLEQYELPEIIRLVILPNRISKIASLNRVVEMARHEILVFSDCRQQLGTNAVKNLAYNFRDESVGTVTAVLKDHICKKRESVVRKLLNKILFQDSQTGSSLNVYGALYAQRKSCFRQFPSDILFDDLFVIVSTLNQKKRLILENTSVIYDIPFDEYYKNERIERLNRGLLLFLVNHYKLIFSLRPADLFRFMIYKYMKLLMPVCLLINATLFLCMTNSLFTWLVIAGMLSLLLCIPKTRSLLFLILRINYHFIKSTFRFFFQKERSLGWVKLKANI